MGFVLFSDGVIIINVDDSFGGNFVKFFVLFIEDDLVKVENFIDNVYVEVILNVNKFLYLNLVKDDEVDCDS